MQLFDILEAYNQEDWTQKLLLQDSDAGPTPAEYYARIINGMLRNFEHRESVMTLKDCVSELEGLGLLDDDIRHLLDPYETATMAWLNKQLTKYPSYQNRIVRQAVLLASLGIRWPSLTAFFLNNKKTVIKQFLQQAELAIKCGDTEKHIVYEDIVLLQEIGVNWPEWEVLKKHLVDSLDKEQQLSESAEGRKMLLDILKKELNSSVYYLINHVNRFGMHLQDWPEIKSWIDDYKTQIITDLLKNISDGIYGASIAETFIKKLFDIGVNWPELTIINNAAVRELQQKEDLKENTAVDSIKVRNIIKKFRTQQSYPNTMVTTLISELRQAHVAESDIKLILISELPYISNLLQKVTDTRWGARTILYTILHLKNVIADRPEIDHLIEQCYPFIQKSIQYYLDYGLYIEIIQLLEAVKNLFPSSYQKIRNMIKTHVLDKLKELLSTDQFYSKQLDALLDLSDSIGIKINFADKYINNIVSNLAADLNDNQTYGRNPLRVDNLSQIITKLLKSHDEQLKTQLIDVINKHKKQLMREILGNIDTFGDVSSNLKSLITVLNTTVNWPELTIIKQHFGIQ